VNRERGEKREEKKIEEERQVVEVKEVAVSETYLLENQNYESRTFQFINTYINNII